MKGPSDEIQPVSMHSARYFFSLPSSSGSFTGIKFIFLKFAQKIGYSPSAFRYWIASHKFLAPFHLEAAMPGNEVYFHWEQVTHTMLFAEPGQFRGGLQFSQHC